MKYCEKCGHPLTMKQLQQEGLVPYCEHCQEFRFPMFNSAISAIVLNPQKDKILLIQQYGRKDYILIAGYINKGENAKQTLIREIKEEVNLDVIQYIYNDNEYFERTNTLMHNYIAIVNDENFSLTGEVDHAKWFSIEEAKTMIKPESLAQHFLNEALSHHFKEKLS